MHQLQQHILSQLIRHSSRRYAELKPTEVEGNLFMYHLRSLMKAGWVTKRADGRYELTPEGLRYADSLSLKTFTPRAQPRMVTLLVCRNATGQYLLLKRKRQPMIGKINFPYGKIHLGESIGQAAARELKEKTGLSAGLTHRGDGYITTFIGDEPVSQIFFHLFIASQIHGQLVPSSADGEVFWTNPHYDDPDVMPSVLDLIALIEPADEKFFFTELTYHL
ncbi:NUDIX domain-containing protein [Candidatus Saccharibacteria bacterium]|nr:NUDIX domain-containing protein [Candidatus Saccharibacteria bacterium]